MDTLVVQVPEKIREKLDERAKAEGKDAQAIALEILARDLGAPESQIETQPQASPAPLYETEKEKHDRVYKKLREEGLIVPLSDELKKLIKPGVNREEVIDAMTQAGGKSLSQIVIEQRQERHDILVYGYKRARKKIRERERKQQSREPRNSKRKSS